MPDLGCSLRAGKNNRHRESTYSPVTRSALHLRFLLAGAWVLWLLENRVLCWMSSNDRDVCWKPPKLPIKRRVRGSVSHRLHCCVSQPTSDISSDADCTDLGTWGISYK